MDCIKLNTLLQNYASKYRYHYENNQKITKKNLCSFFSKNKKVLDDQWVHPNLVISLYINKLITNITVVTKKRNIYYVHVGSKKFKTRFYIYFWFNLYKHFIQKDEVENLKKEIFKKNFISNNGFKNLKIELNTEKIYFDGSTKYYRIDGLFCSDKLSIAFEINENHHLKKDFLDLARPVKESLSEIKFSEKDKIYRFITIWEYKLVKKSRSNKKYLDSLLDNLVNLIYISHVSEKKYVINRLKQVFNIEELAKAIYKSHKDKKNFLINFQMFFKKIVTESELPKVFNTIIEYQSKINYHLKKDDSDIDFTDEENEEILDISTDREYIKGNTIDKAKLNFRGLDTCLALLVNPLLFSIETVLQAEKTHNDVLDCLVNSYKEIYKEQKKYINGNTSIDSDKKDILF